MGERCEPIAPAWHPGRPGKRGGPARWDRRAGSVEGAARPRVEHPYQVVKGRFGFARTRHRGIRRNHNALGARSAPSNLAMAASAGRTLAPTAAQAKGPGRRRAPGHGAGARPVRTYEDARAWISVELERLECAVVPDDDLFDHFYGPLGGHSLIQRAGWNSLMHKK